MLSCSHRFAPAASGARAALEWCRGPARHGLPAMASPVLMVGGRGLETLFDSADCVIVLREHRAFGEAAWKRHI